jgi:FlaG/FlaF family flagellin (archaellin)
VSAIALNAILFSNISYFTAAVVWGLVQVWNKYTDARQMQVLREVKKTGEETKLLTNGAMLAQLKMNVEFAKERSVDKHRLAQITKEAGDIAAATASDLVVTQQVEILQEYLLRQAKVDAAS